MRSAAHPRLPPVRERHRHPPHRQLRGAEDDAGLPRGYSCPPAVEECKGKGKGTGTGTGKGTGTGTGTSKGKSKDTSTGTGTGKGTSEGKGTSTSP